MIEPLPNCFSICRIAWSIALDFSVTAISSSQRASEHQTAPACTHRRRIQFLGRNGYQSTFSLRFGLMTSKVMGWTGAAVPFRLSSRSSSSLDLFFLFLSLASPRPVGTFFLPSGGSSGHDEHSPCAAYSHGVTTARPASARVTTRTGDGGETSLFGKDRVRKTDARIEALGELDEAQSAIGMARAMAPRSSLGRELLELQRGLYVAKIGRASCRERV